LGHHNAVIWSPPLDLRNLNYCYVEFYHWYEIGENDYGRFVIYTPADQKSWYFEQDYEGTKPFWSRDTYNLQWFIDKGYPEIQVGFHFVSQDQPPDLSGWYIDDVRVYDTVDLNLPAAPGQVEPVPVPATVAEMLPLPQLQPLKRNDQEFLEQAGKPLPEGIISREIPLRQTAPEPQPLSQTLSQTLSITGEPLLYWIPVEATLTALGTDCSTTTNPEDGTFHLSLPSGEPITLQVEAAGYERETRAIDPTEIERFQVFLLGFDLEMGDLNQVAGVDVGDAILLLRYIVDLHSLDQDQRLAADVNLDNHLNVGDAILMLRHIVGLTPSLPVYN
jgi:hypothetical protein